MDFVKRLKLKENPTSLSFHRMNTHPLSFSTLAQFPYVSAVSKIR